MVNRKEMVWCVVTYSEGSESYFMADSYRKKKPEQLTGYSRIVIESSVKRERERVMDGVRESGKGRRFY